MLRSWIDDVIGRLKQLGTHADGLEEQCRRLQSELSTLHEARRANTTPLRCAGGDPTGMTMVDTIASAQNLYVARAAFREFVKQYPDRRMTLQIAAHRRARAGVQSEFGLVETI